MKAPIQKFTIIEAIKHYAGNPFVRCMAEGEVVQINSQTLHAERYKEHTEQWFWAYSLDDEEKSILLYAPSHLTDDFKRAEIITMEGGES